MKGRGGNRDNRVSNPPIRLLVSRDHAKQLVDWYEMIDAVNMATNEDTELAASIERAIEQHDAEMQRRKSNETITEVTPLDKHLNNQAVRQVRWMLGGKP